jgi:hypothetical protein
MMTLQEYIPNQIWTCKYPVHYAGCDFTGRMTVIRLANGYLMLHSPCQIDADLKQAIQALGEVGYIVAPGSFHHLHISSAQDAFPEATTYICPGIERKQPQLHFDWFLAENPPEDWSQDLDQVLVRGTRWMWEVVFFHRASKTLILVDLIENITDKTESVNWQMKFWWKVIFDMWNHPKPAPEYQLGWSDKKAAKESLEKILSWDFQRIILAHGDLIEEDARGVAQQAWAKPLSGK